MYRLPIRTLLVVPVLGAAMFACGSDATRSTRADSGAAVDTDTGGADADAGSSVEAEEHCAAGASVFDETVVHELRFELSQSDWQSMISEAENSPEYGGPQKTYFEATMELNGSVLGSPLAIRLKGHSSLLVAAETGHAFPFKVDFNRVDPDQNLDGLGALLLHPNLEGVTSLNEYLSYGAIRAHGIPTARTAFARVFVNGESLGLYSLVEHIRGDFVRCHYSEPYGDLYKPEEPVGNLAWLGDTIEAYGDEMEFKWPRESVTGHQSLLQLLRVLRDGDITRFDDVLHVPEVLSYLAVNVALGNYDYYASFGHNYYLYESTPGRFTMVPWDMNFSQGEMEHPCGLGRNTSEWPVSHWLLADSARVGDYLGLMSEFLAGPASPASLNARIDTAVALLGDDLNLGAVEELRDKITRRADSLTAAIASGIDVCPVGSTGGAGDACGECVDDLCEEQLDTCFDDDECDCVAECVFEDTDEDICLADCEVREMPAELDALIECIVGRCEELCLSGSGELGLSDRPRFARGRPYGGG